MKLSIHAAYFFTILLFAGGTLAAPWVAFPCGGAVGYLGAMWQVRAMQARATRRRWQSGIYPFEGRANGHG